MNIKPIQFNHQWVAALLFTGLILALAAGLAWAGANAGSPTVQPAQTAQDCAYTPQPGQTGVSAAEVVCPAADLTEDKGDLSSESQLNSGKGGAAGGVIGSNR